MEEIDAVVIGGGAAGLQAGLTLGRMHVPAMLFDSGEYRNAASELSFDALGCDGTAPAELRRRGREEVARYGTRVLDLRVDDLHRDGEAVAVASGGMRWRARALILATGVRDEILPIPGLAELWGTLALPCPYCHEHEFAGRRIAVVSAGDHAEHVSGLLRRIGSDVPVLPPDAVAEVARVGDGVRIRMRDGSGVDAACVFVPSGPRPRDPFADRLGLDTVDGAIVVDERQRASVPGIWAAGDAARRAHPFIPASVVTAMASGLVAAADCAAALAPPAPSPCDGR